MSYYKTIFSAVYFFLCLFGNAQEDCNEFLTIYDSAFQELLNKNKDTTVIELDSKLPNEYTLKDLKSTHFLTIKEIEKIQLALEKDFTPCKELKSLIASLQTASLQCSENGSYLKGYYSRPFHISKNKVVIFISFSTRNKKYSGGKKVGADIVKIYEYYNQSWEFREEFMLSIF